MKTLLLIFLSAFTFSAVSFAAVEITEDGRVIKDGATLGFASDVLANKVVAPPKFQEALLALIAKLKTAATDAEAQAAEEKNKREAIVEAAEKDPAELAAKVAEAKQTRREKRLAEITAEEAKLSAEKAALEAKAAKAEAATKR